MIFSEPRIFAWLHLRKPCSLEITANGFFYNGKFINHTDVKEIVTKAVWFLPAWLDGRELVIHYETDKQSRHIHHVNNVATITKAEIQAFTATTSHLCCVLAELEKTANTLETRRASVYEPIRFVRHSQAHRFAKTELNVHDKLYKETILISTHPLLEQARKGQAESLVARVRTISPYVYNTETARSFHNKQYIAHFKEMESGFFQSVESKPLTDEQIDAALVFEDATLVVAAAGSGKSSCIVSKIGFALKTGLFQDHEILALAYNKGAAKNLETRLNEKLSKALNRSVSVASKTFHGFGLSILKSAKHANTVLKEGEKEENKHLKLVIATLMEKSPEFREALTDWLCFSSYENPQPVGSSDDLDECARLYEECCRKRINVRRDGSKKVYEPSIPTFNRNIYVRSLEERAIANWLILHGIIFEYERPDYDGAKRLGLGMGASGKQKPYKPDFTYTLTESLKNGKSRTVRVVHEHFGLNADGDAPAWMGGKKYAQQADQKRRMFQIWMAEGGTETERVVFFESRSSQIRDGSIWAHIKHSLLNVGIRIEPPHENIRTKALESFRQSSDLEHLIIEFVLLFKESGLTKDKVEEESSRSDNPHRATLFLRVAFMVFENYRTTLRTDGNIDFADMLRDAVDLLRTRQVVTPYRFILVDEFQDIARLKADLVKSVLDQAIDTSIVFFVGDDWQTINRFAGSDVSIFMGADKYFARHTEKLQLSRTFRCAQGIADVSRALVMKNRKQFHKDVTAVLPTCIPLSVRVVFHGATPEERRVALSKELDRIALVSMEIGLIIPSVFLLRRTQKSPTAPEGLDNKYLDELCIRFADRLKITSNSVHGSKGCEADFVILPGLDSGFRGFPDDRQSEPLLDLVLPKLQDPVEEERRLLYVGITRARHQAVILTNGEKPSQFILELDDIRKHHTTIEWITNGIDRMQCPKCTIGSLVIPHAKATSRVCSRTLACGHLERKNRDPGRLGSQVTTTAATDN